VATGHNVPATVCRCINLPLNARKARRRWDPSGRIKAGPSSVSNWNPPRSEIRGPELPWLRAFPISGPDSCPAIQDRPPPDRNPTSSFLAEAPTCPPRGSRAAFRHPALLGSLSDAAGDAQGIHYASAEHVHLPRSAARLRREVPGGRSGAQAPGRNCSLPSRSRQVLIRPLRLASQTHPLAAPAPKAGNVSQSVLALSWCSGPTQTAATVAGGGGL
jgi:hypothetical protein